MIDPVVQDRRTQFWRDVDARLAALGLEPASNAEVAGAFRRTTCTRQAARWIAEARPLCSVCGDRVRCYGHPPTCLDCFGRSEP